MKKYKKIIILLIITFISNSLFSQISTDFMKYWYYRNRLKYFVVSGDKIGESQIICVRNRIVQVDNDGSNNPNDPERKNVDYGQHGKHDGLYIGVLATEYYLLEENGQAEDAENTLNELYLSIYAVKKYWDSLAEPFYTNYLTGNNFNAKYNGFFIRGNVPCDFLDETNSFNNEHGFNSKGISHLSLLNKGLTPDDIWEKNNPYQFGNLKRGHPAYIDHRTSEPCMGNSTSSPNTPCNFNGHPESMSQDEAIGILLGCALAAKLSYGKTQLLAQEMSGKMISYISNLFLQNGPLRWWIYNPFYGEIIPPGAGGWTYAYGPAFLKSAYHITNNGQFNSAYWSFVSSIQHLTWLITSTGAFPKDNDLTASVMAMSNYFGSNNAARIGSITKKNDWDTFYILLWEVLNDKSRSEKRQKELLDKTLSQLDTAPCEGPYNYGDGYYPSGGWASTYRWFKQLDKQNGAEVYTGNYHGLDYMLLYNLNQIILLRMEDDAPYKAPFYVNYVDKNLIGTVNSPTNFVAFSSITSTQTINQTAPIVNYKAGDSIHLKTGFHAIDGANFHAFIKDIDCSDGGSMYPDSMYTNYYDSLISMPQNLDALIEDDDTIINNSYTLPCPIDTLKFEGGVFCDTCTFYWDFGNGQTSTAENPSVFYNTPGTYNMTVILTDTNNVSDTMQIDIIVPECKIYGYLAENTSCGGTPVEGDSLYITYNGTPVVSVNPAVTQENGYFNFNGAQLDLLNPNLLYTITTSSGIAIEGMQAQTLTNWEAQSPLSLHYTVSVNEEWVARYNSEDSLFDIANAVDLMGNVYVTGTTYSTSSASNIITIKYDPSGTQLWAVPYNGSGSSCFGEAKAITVDASGNVYITGKSCISNVPTITTISYDSDGILRRVQTYAYSSTYDKGVGNCIIQDNEGNIIVGGTATSSNPGNSIICLFKNSSNGNLLWSANYIGPATPAYDNLTALSVDASNNVYATGYSNGIGTSSDFVTIKYNSSGIQQWVARYNNTDNGADYSYSNAIDNNGNIIVTGTSYKNSSSELVTINYNPANGSTNWIKTYSLANQNKAQKVLCNNDTGIYVCGQVSSGNGGLLVLKYNTDGDLIWSTNTLQNTGYTFHSADIDMSDNIYTSGAINDPGDIATLKLDNNGNVQWTTTYNGTANANDIPSQVKVSTNGNVYVCGYSTGTNTLYDFTTIKYSQCLSTSDLLKTNNDDNSFNSLPANAISNNISNSNIAVQVIPNPNNGNMQIIYEIPENTTGTFDVYNMIGNKLFSYPLNGGKNSFTISRDDLTQGVYFYRATAGGKVIAKDKIVIIK